MNEILCKPRTSYINFGINMLVHVIFLFFIISTIFIIFITKISSDTINTEFTDLIRNTLLQNYNKLNINKTSVLNKTDFQNKTSVLNKTDFQNKDIENNTIDLINFDNLLQIYSSEDMVRKYNNKNVFKSIYITIILLILTFIISLVISKSLCNKIPLKHILVENIIIFIGVGLVEYMFFKNIILKYIPIKPSFIVEYVLQQFKKKIV